MTTESKNLVEKSEERARIKRVLADKAYSYENFEFLQSKGIEPAIPVRKGGINLKHPRSEEARKQKDFDRWKEYMVKEIAAKVWIR